VGLVGILRALVGVVGAVVAVGYERTLGVVVEGQEPVLVGTLLPKHIRDCLFLSLNSPPMFNYCDYHFCSFLSLYCVAPM